MTPRTRYLLTTLALLAVGAGYTVVGGRPPSAPAWHVTSAPRPAPPRPAPTARQMLERRAELALTDAQRARLETLDSSFRRDASAIESAVDQASREFSRWMEDARNTGRPSLGEIQHRSEDVRELSASLRERRRLHAEAAASVLTEDQRRRLAASAAATSGGVR